MIGKNYREGKYSKARRQQIQLAALVSLSPMKKLPQMIAALDVAYSAKNTAYAAVVLFSFPELELVESHTIVAEVDFPYISGLLSFRELPTLLLALAKLSHKPELLLVDGQGICHPRRLGLASHLGLTTGIASIGAAKSHLCGDYEPPKLVRGDHSPIWLKGDEVGAVLCTRTGVKPLFVSPGHLCDIAGAIAMVLECSKGFRVPEPLRLAHKLATAAKQKKQNNG